MNQNLEERITLKLRDLLDSYPVVFFDLVKEARAKKEGTIYFNTYSIGIIQKYGLTTNGRIHKTVKNVVRAKVRGRGTKLYILKDVK